MSLALLNLGSKDEYYRDVYDQPKGGNTMAVDGTYNITVHTPMGDQKSKLTLKTDGNSLSGFLEDAMSGVAEFTGGTVAGKEVSWTVTPKTPMGPLKLDCKATIDGDKISGQAVSMFGPAPFEGTRV
jgi:hypothetical protein